MTGREHDGIESGAIVRVRRVWYRPEWRGQLATVVRVEYSAGKRWVRIRLALAFADPEMPAPTATVLASRVRLEAAAPAALTDLGLVGPPAVERCPALEDSEQRMRGGGFRCDTCGASFGDDVLLIVHQGGAHGGESS